MGQVADAVLAMSKQPANVPGCIIMKRLAEVALREDIDDDDLAALRAAVEDRMYSARAIEQVFRNIGMTCHRDNINLHRNHGDCAARATK